MYGTSTHLRSLTRNILTQWNCTSLCLTEGKQHFTSRSNTWLSALGYSSLSFAAEFCTCCHFAFLWLISCKLYYGSVVNWWSLVFHFQFQTNISVGYEIPLQQGFSLEGLKKYRSLPPWTYCWCCNNMFTSCTQGPPLRSLGLYSLFFLSDLIISLSLIDMITVVHAVVPGEHNEK